MTTISTCSSGQINMHERRAHRAITIVGLGRTGQALGLAIRQHLPDVRLIGHDRDPEASKDAKKAGAVHTTHWNLITATDNAAVVILALPAHEVIATLRALVGELQPGTVITDTASLKLPVILWAKENLPPELHYVGGHPLVSWPSQLSPNDLSGATYCLTPSPETHPDAVSIITSLVSSLGAKPLFVSAEEHDSFIMALEHLPTLAAAAQLQVLHQSGIMRDLATFKAALPDNVMALSSRLGQLAAADENPASRETLARWLRAYADFLDKAATALEAGNEGVISAMLERQDASSREFLRGGDNAAMDTPEDVRSAHEGWRRFLGMR